MAKQSEKHQRQRDHDAGDDRDSRYAASRCIGLHVGIDLCVTCLSVTHNMGDIITGNFGIILNKI